MFTVLIRRLIESLYKNPVSNKNIPIPYSLVKTILLDTKTFVLVRGINHISHLHHAGGSAVVLL